MMKNTILKIFLAQILLFLAATLSVAQDKVSVKGQVLDSKTRETVIGASVMVKGTTNGAITDLDGNFTISVPKGSVLVISSIGYEDYTINVDSAIDNIKVALKTSSEFLDEVVVVGYGSVKKENLTGAVDQVSSEAFEGRPVANATQMLQGVVPNLNIDLVDGKPGRTADYNIRGTTSIGAGGSALVLIDGVEGDPSQLNPSDIESVSVLKDAASSAIYGSRAPYGVVLITTKNPDENGGKFNINYSTNLAVMDPTAIPDVVTDGYVYASLFAEAYYNDTQKWPTSMNKGQEFSRTWLEDFRQRQLAGIRRTTEVGPDGKYVYYGNTDYYDFLYKDATFAQTHNVTASGNAGPVSFYVSGRFYKYDGLFKLSTDEYQQINLRAKLTANLRPWLKLTENISFNNEKYHIPSTSNQQSGGNYWSAINAEGHVSSPIFNPDGSLTKSGAYAVGGLVTGNNYQNRKVKGYKTTTGLRAEFLDKALHLNADFSFSDRQKTELQKRTVIPYSEGPDMLAYLGTPGTDDYLSEYSSSTEYIAANAYAEYEKTFASKHYFKAMVGYNYEQQKYKTLSSKRYDLLTLDTDCINLATGDMAISSSESVWRVAGMMFRLNYTYDERFLFEVNGRYDGSSKFPTTSQWGFFPSGSAAWRVSKEHWWKLDPVYISSLKIRGSFGELGNGSVSPYSFLEKFSFSNMGKGTSEWCRNLDGVSGMRYTSIPSQIPDNLTWETSRTIDVGLDASFYKGKVELNFDWYRRRTYDMYTTGPTLPDTYGASAPKGNYADMYTDGYEIALSYNDSYNVLGSPMSFGVKATLADSRSFITKYFNPTYNITDYYEGYEIGTIWGYVCEGLFQNQEQIDNYWGPGVPYKNTRIPTANDGVTRPGDVIFADLNHNNRIDSGSDTVSDPGDRKIIGNSHPRYQYSLSLNFSWYGVYASAFFQGVGKRQWVPSKESPFWGQYCRPYAQAYKWQLENYWTPETPDAFLPRYTGYYAIAWQDKPIDRYTMDVSYIRLKNLQIGYNFPSKLLKKAHMKQLSVYLSAENLWTWSPMNKYTTDFDVVTVCYGSDTDLTGEQGDGYNYPTMRTFSLGLTIGF